jgi:Lysylphosphatidylglycerol synthase TM region
MIDQIETIARAAGHAIDLIASDAASLNPWWLIAGVALHLIHQAVRIRGWFNIVRAAYPAERRLRYRDVVAAYYAGSGLNAIVPARGGDVLKVHMVKRRLDGGNWSTLVATFVPETLFETLLGAALLVWMLARGFLPLPTSRLELPTLDVSLILAHPVISTIVLVAGGAGLALLVRRLRRTAQSFLARLRRGLAILHSPRAFFEGVVTWQALGRLIRLASLACLMAAFALPVTLASVVLVMAAQGGGRIVPIAPASAGLRLAMLSYGLPEVTGKPVDIASITAFHFVASGALLLCGLAIALPIIAREYGTLRPRRAIARARAYAARAGSLSPASTSPSLRNSST